MEISNKVKNLKNISVDEFLKLEFNKLKSEDRNVKKLVEAIKKSGFSFPIFLWKDHDYVIDGMGRKLAVEALIKDGHTIKEIPCVEIEADTLEEAKQKTLEVSSQFGDITVDSLKEFSKDFDINFDTIQIGNFSMDDMVEPTPKDDEIPEVPKEAKSKLGDLYEIGEHRVLCGDSTKVDDVEKLMNGKKADMVFTSPPYNANTKAGEGDIFNGKKGKKLYAEGYSDNLSTDEYVKFAQSVLNLCFAYTEGFIFWNVSYNKNSRYQYIQQITPYLEYLREQICWKKSSTIPFKGSMMRDWEPIYLFSTIKANLGLEKVTSNFWEVSNTHSQTESHKACYPIELVVKGIELINGSKRVLDPFIGSGSTLIASEKTGRRCFGLELDPKYVDVIVQRYVDYTGNTKIKKNGKEIDWDITINKEGKK